MPLLLLHSPDAVVVPAEHSARLQAAGMRFHCPPQAQDTGFVTYGRDPDGNVVGLLEFTNAS